VPNIPGVADHAAPTPKGALVNKIRKALVAVLGTAAMVVSTGVLHESAEVWVNAALALATAAGVYGVRNEPAATVHDPNLRA
jgi:hypothetical protein